MALKFKHPMNNYVEESSCPGLWAFLFGFFYLVYKRAWFAAFIAFVLVAITAPTIIVAIIIWAVVAFKAEGIVRKSYLKRGWTEVTSDSSS